MMPGLDGMEVLKHIRSHPIHKDLPVVVYSALSDQGTMQTAKQNGAQSYLVKSKASFADIQSCIEELLGGAAATA
jgi:CheY-like chemotaxis protein